MTPPSGAVVTDGHRLTQKPWGYSAGRIALLFVAVLNLIWATVGAYRAVTVVRSERIFEYAWNFVAYPAAFAALGALAIWWLRRERAAGAVLGSLLLVFHGGRTLLDATSGAGYPSGTSRVPGQVFEGTIGACFVVCAISLAIAARMFHRQRTMGPAGS